MPFAKRAAPKKAAKKSAGGLGFYGAAVGRPAVKVRTKAVEPVVSKKTSVARKVKRIDARMKQSFDPGLVFVAMSFRGDTSNEVFSAIKDVCKSVKLNARRVDENFTSGFIILEIINLIEQAEFLIFDLSEERPNVYYELGYAHGVGNAPSNILLVAREGTQLHFDISALRIKFYKSTEDLRRIVTSSLKAMMKASR